MARARRSDNRSRQQKQTCLGITHWGGDLPTVSVCREASAIETEYSKYGIALLGIMKRTSSRDCSASTTSAIFNLAVKRQQPVMVESTISDTYCLRKNSAQSKWFGRVVRDTFSLISSHNRAQQKDEVPNREAKRVAPKLLPLRRRFGNNSSAIRTNSDDVIVQCEVDIPAHMDSPEQCSCACMFLLYLWLM